MPPPCCSMPPCNGPLAYILEICQNEPCWGLLPFCKARPTALMRLYEIWMWRLWCVCVGSPFLLCLKSWWSLPFVIQTLCSVTPFCSLFAQDHLKCLFVFFSCLFFCCSVWSCHLPPRSQALRQLGHKGKSEILDILHFRKRPCVMTHLHVFVRRGLNIFSLVGSWRPLLTEGRTLDGNSYDCSSTNLCHFVVSVLALGPQPHYASS